MGSNPISSTKSQMLKAHSSTMNCSKRPGDCEARASVSPTVHSLCARVKSQTRGGFNETKAMVYVPGYTLLVGLLVIMSAALARCVSGKVIGKLEYGDPSQARSWLRESQRNADQERETRCSRSPRNFLSVSYPEVTARCGAEMSGRHSCR